MWVVYHLHMNKLKRYTRPTSGAHGEWQSESDWGNQEEAAKRVHYLNGGKQ